MDIAILRELAHPQQFQWNVRPSYAEIARGVGADEETVRLRVRRLQEQGVIQGFDVGVNPHLFGRTFVRFGLPRVAPEARAKVADALRAVDGARILFDNYGGRYALVAMVEPGPAAIARHATLLGAVAGGPVATSTFTLPEPTVELSPEDWRVVGALRRNLRAPYAEVAAELDVSERTLRRRVDRLTEGRALILDINVDFTKAAGVLPCMLHVAHGPGSPVEAIREVMRATPRTVFSWFEGDHSRVSFMASSLGELEEMQSRLAAMTGPHDVIDLDLHLRRETLPTWLDEQVRRRAAPAPRA